MPARANGRATRARKVVGESAETTKTHCVGQTQAILGPGGLNACREGDVLLTHLLSERREGGRNERQGEKGLGNSRTARQPLIRPL